MTLLHMADEQLRPRERATRGGLAELADEEVVALLLGTGCRGEPVADVARAVLADNGGLGGLARAGPGRLSSTRGMGEAKAWRLAAAVEIGRRLRLRSAAERLHLATPGAVARAFTERIGHLEHEEMWLVAIDGRSNVRGVRQLARGGRHGLVTSPKEVLSAALCEAATAFFLVHNHPSGHPSPSREDLMMTHDVMTAAQVVGVPLCDHVIVTACADRYYSMFEDGMLPSES